MKYLLGFLLGFLLFNNMNAQSLDEARKLYLEGKYEEAKPAFEKAIKASPRNASYNQWYGTCLLETGDLEAAEPYLKFAASKDIQGAFNSLGKLYFLQYRFEESVEYYENYYNILIKKKQENDAETIKPLIDLSRKAARMLEHCEDIQIIDSIIVDKGDFLNFYNLSDESGSLQFKDETRLSTLYENQLKDKQYFSKKDEEGFFRIYSRSKLLDDWSEDVLIALPGDSTNNDNYPYVLSDGITIYYASTGNGAIGGYDLFITRYNMNSDSYFMPEQLGMPFNSIYNDYMMAIDEYNNIGYFATDRYQPDNKIVIYTFIPNQEKIIIETDDEEYLISRAEVRSIRDSWKEGKNYAAILASIKEGNKMVRKQEQNDFSFVINDNIIYHSLDDFDSDAARDIFIQSQSINQEIQEIQKRLDEKRIEYSNMTSAKRQTLSGAILLDEKRLGELFENHRKMEIRARNAEIKLLKQ